MSSPRPGRGGGLTPRGRAIAMRVLLYATAILKVNQLFSPSLFTNSYFPSQKFFGIFRKSRLAPLPLGEPHGIRKPTPRTNPWGKPAKKSGYHPGFSPLIRFPHTGPSLARRQEASKSRPPTPTQGAHPMRRLSSCKTCDLLETAITHKTKIGALPDPEPYLIQFSILSRLSLGTLQRDYRLHRHPHTKDAPSLLTQALPQESPLWVAEKREREIINQLNLTLATMTSTQNRTVDPQTSPPGKTTQRPSPPSTRLALQEEEPQGHPGSTHRRQCHTHPQPGAAS